MDDIPDVPEIENNALDDYAAIDDYYFQLWRPMQGDENALPGTEVPEVEELTGPDVVQPALEETTESVDPTTTLESEETTITAQPDEGTTTGYEEYSENELAWLNGQDQYDDNYVYDDYYVYARR